MAIESRARLQGYSVVILTYNRNHLLRALLLELQPLADRGVQIVVVDNASAPPAEEVTGGLPFVTTVRSERNLGASGRNLGFAAAGGDIVVCLDDDVEGLPISAIETLEQIFVDETIAGVNFKVVEKQTGRLANWVHHRDSDRYADTTFDTYEITEGAVALRRSVLEVVGGYPEAFFLSHEGPDLAYRVMNLGFRMIYSPEISVMHSFAGEGRPGWRNYYFDTRNTFWLAARNLPLFYGLRLVTKQSLAMLVYSIRDGYLRWWVRGMRDGLRGLPGALRERHPLNRDAYMRVKAIDRFRPGLLHMVRKRLFRRGVPF